MRRLNSAETESLPYWQSIQVSTTMNLPTCYTGSKKEASALDVGLISSDPNLRAPYEGLKKDHLDRLNGADLFWMVMLIGGVFVALALLIWSSQ